MLLDTSYTKCSGTAAGTTVIMERPGYLDKIIFPASATGTITLYDCDTAAGTSAANAVIVLDQNKVGTATGMPYVFPVGARMVSGLTAVVGGTTSYTVIWG